MAESGRIDEQHVRVERDVGASPTEAWAVVGDVGGLAEWVPGVAAVVSDGDVRAITFDDGSSARERIVDHDDANRRYSYAYESGPLPVSAYTSTLSVVPDPGGTAARLTWEAAFTVDPQVDGERIRRVVDRAYRSALEELENRLRAGKHESSVPDRAASAERDT
jgi:carbon monoxide dehydrogenase subunit G